MSTAAHSVREGQRFKGDTNLTVVSCASCHMTYAIPTSLYKAALAYPGGRPDGWVMTCPLGHSWHYVGQSVEDKLKDERLARQRANERLQAERDLRQDTERRLSAQKGATTRARNQRDRDRQRVKHGVCPCCNRTFKNLAAHMAGQHPGFGPEGPHV